MPTIAPAIGPGTDSVFTSHPVSRRRRRPPQRVDHQRLPRARQHTAGSLKTLRTATSAAERRDGLTVGETPRELLAAVPAWSSRRSHLAVLRGLARQKHTKTLCRAAQIAVDTWLAVAINDAYDADDATGRGMRTSQAVAAARVGRSERTVRRARAVSVRLGVLVELYRGRELSGDERLSLYDEKPGHKQRGFPNVYAVAVCPRRQRGRIAVPRPGRWAVVRSHLEGFGHLPPLGGVSSGSNVEDGFPYAVADAPREAEPAPPALRPRNRRPGIGLAYRTLAHQTLSALLCGVRPGAAAALFVQHDQGGWTSDALAHALRAEAQHRNIGPYANVRNPYGLLKTLLEGVGPSAAAYFTQGIPLQAPAPPDPCGGVHCDGYGWTHVLINGIEHAQHCPDCSPAVRTGQ